MLHGFRSSFRDRISKVTSYTRDAEKMDLAHTTENTVETAYRHGDLFKRRRAMMQEWAGYIA